MGISRFAGDINIFAPELSQKQDHGKKLQQVIGFITSCPEDITNQAGNNWLEAEESTRSYLKAYRFIKTKR